MPCRAPRHRRTTRNWRRPVVARSSRFAGSSSRLPGGPEDPSAIRVKWLVVNRMDLPQTGARGGPLAVREPRLTCAYSGFIVKKTRGISNLAYMNRHCRGRVVVGGALRPSRDGPSAPENRLRAAGGDLGLSGTFFWLSLSAIGNSYKSIYEPPVV